MRMQALQSDIQWVAAGAHLPVNLFNQLVSDMAGEQHLLRQSGSKLTEQCREGLSSVAVCDSRIVAHVTLWDLKVKNCYELGTAWVCPSIRGHDHGKEMYRRLLNGNPDKNIFTTTTNPVAITVGADVGLVRICRSSLPAALIQASCVCSPQKMRALVYQACTLAWGESQLSVETHPCVFQATTETVVRLGLKIVSPS